MPKPTEVLLTDALALTDGRFLLAAQWPRSIATSGAGSGERHDPMLAAETIRQVGLYLCRRFLGAPDSHAEVYDARRLDEVPWPVALSVRMRFSAAGREFGSAFGRVRVLSEEEYDTFRGPYAAADPAPDDVRWSRTRPGPC